MWAEKIRHEKASRRGSRLTRPRQGLKCRAFGLK
jgi:hypothetical protein